LRRPQSQCTETQRRPPEVRSTAFTARPPNLPPRSLMAVDFAIRCSLVRPGWPRYPVFVHRAAVLLHASFRPHLAMTPLRFANPSPPSGWVKDFHLQAADHARHTPLRGSPHFVRLGLDGLRSLPHLVAMIDTSMRVRFALAPSYRRQPPPSRQLGTIALREARSANRVVPLADKFNRRMGAAPRHPGRGALPWGVRETGQAHPAQWPVDHGQPMAAASGGSQGRRRTRSAAPAEQVALTAEHAAAHWRPIDALTNCPDAPSPYAIA